MLGSASSSSPLAQLIALVGSGALSSADFGPLGSSEQTTADTWVKYSEPGHQSQTTVPSLLSFPHVCTGLKVSLPLSAPRLVRMCGSTLAPGLSAALFSPSPRGATVFQCGAEPQHPSCSVWFGGYRQNCSLRVLGPLPPSLLQVSMWNEEGGEEHIQDTTSYPLFMFW